jgi:acyl-CoA reductase-like NAD-dependent aldehyde dehydrogenase
LRSVLERRGIFVDNQLVPSAGNQVIDVLSPATQARIGRVTLGVEEDIESAVAAARSAFDLGSWTRMSDEDRRAIIRRAGELLAPRSAELSELVTSENGVLIRFRQGDVASQFDYYASLGYPAPERRADAWIVHEPVGVVGAIVPWNMPVSLGLSKVLPALLGGNTVVLKPSPETPLHDYLIAEAFAEAGLPPGVLNVVPADRDVSEYLVRHPDVDMISFTGSTVAGRRVGSICGEQIKRVVLELGGKSAAIVLDDIDVEAMAATVLNTGMLLNNGEACMAWTRILVPRTRHDELVDAFCAVLKHVHVGDPLDPTTDVGPLVAERQRDRVEAYIRSGQDEGAKIVFGGGRPAGLDRGWYVEPTLFIGANNSMKICREEVFGPVGTVIPYDTEAEAIRIANDTNYGLAGAIFTADADKGRSLAPLIRAGTVCVNGLGGSRALPFGGYKDSGIGRSNGPEGFAEFFEIKTIVACT